MDWLKDILAKFVEEDKLTEIIEGINKEFPKHAIPKGKFNEVNEELKVTKAQVDEVKKSMEEMNKELGTVEEYKTKNAELQTKIKTIEEETTKKVAQITKKTQLKELLLENNAHKDALDLLVEKYVEVAEVEGDKLKNPEDLITKIKSEKGGLFVEVSSQSKEKDGNKKGNTPDVDEKLRGYFGLYNK